MPYIALPEGFPGIRSLFMYSPGTAKPLNAYRASEGYLTKPFKIAQP